MMTRLATLSFVAVALLLASCTSDDPPAPEPSPIATVPTSPAIETTATPTPTVPPQTTLASLDLPEGCQLFDEGRWNRPFEARVSTSLELRAAPCGQRALASASGLLVEWSPVGLDDPMLSAVLVPDGSGLWTATVTFPEPGSWRADLRLGIVAFFEVVAADGGLTHPYAGLPLPALPREIVVLDGAASEVRQRFIADFGGIGLLRNPDRLVFLRPRDGGARVVAADLATGEIEELLDVTSFTNVYSAPDGRAVAIEWGEPGKNLRHLAVIDAATGALTRYEDVHSSALNVAWAPDSSFLFVAGERLRMIGPDGNVRAERALPEGEAPLLMWAPDSSYTLVRFFGQQTRLERLDPATLVAEVVFDASAGARVTSLTGITIAPRSGQVAISWTEGSGEPIHISVVPADALVGAQLRDHLVATFELPGDFGDFGGLSWSPDEQSLAFTAFGVTIDDTPPSFPGSAMGVLDLATGAARQLSSSTEFYASYISAPVWSADGRTLFALRFPCTGCGPGTSGVDIVDVASGTMLQSLDDTSHLGPTADGAAQLLSTPAGLLRSDGRSAGELLVPATGNTPFSAQHVALDDGKWLAIAIASPRTQTLAAPVNGATLSVLGTQGSEPVVLLDTNTAVVRTSDGWARQRLNDGALEPYVASGGAYEKFDFVLSPSGALALDVDYEGFTILDAARPAAPAIVPRRPPVGVVWRRPAWSWNERRIAFADGTTIGIFNLETAQEQVIETDTLGIGLDSDQPFHQIWAITWTPDGALLFATPEALWSLDVDRGASATLVTEAPRPGAFTQGTLLSYSPDGGTLVAGTQFGIFALESDLSWRQIAPLGVPVGGGSLSWAPDSRAIAYVAAAGGAPEGIIVASLDGSGAYRLVAPPTALRVLGWLPDGRIVWVAAALGE